MISKFLWCLALAPLLLSACSTGESDEAREAGASEHERVLLSENFDSYEDGERPSGWWMEGGEDYFVENGRLHIKSDPSTERAPGYVATVWNEKKFSGDVRVEFDAHVTASSLDVNNINFFLLYSHPAPDSTLYETRNTRADGGYGYYHELNGYIFTFVQSDESDESNNARFRMRRCPGFELIDENHAFESRPGKTYHVSITRRGDNLSYAVDGTAYLQATDEKYNWTDGLMGVRTFHTDLWVDNLRVTRPTE
jgi:hypothetical protein